MKVYLSVDMEGIAGVNHPHPTNAGHDRYPAAVELMVGETNAAIEGALDPRATAVVTFAARLASLRPDARVHACLAWNACARFEVHPLELRVVGVEPLHPHDPHHPAVRVATA